MIQNKGNKNSSNAKMGDADNNNTQLNKTGQGNSSAIPDDSPLQRYNLNLRWDVSDSFLYADTAAHLEFISSFTDGPYNVHAAFLDNVLLEEGPCKKKGLL